MKSSLEFINISRKAFGKDAQIARNNNLPLLYQNTFESWNVKSNDEDNVVICFDNLPSFMELMQLFSIIKKQNPNTFIYISRDFYNISKDYIKIIYKNRIPFVDYTGTRLINRDKINFYEEMLSDIKAGTKYVYTKNTQLVFKFYIFNEVKSYTVRDIASTLNISPASVSRANETLYYYGVLTKTGFGAGLEYTIINKKKAIRALKEELLLPYDNTYYLLLEDYDYERLSSGLISGDYALSEYTDLLPSSDTITYAIWKKQFMTFYNAYTSLTYDNPTHFLAVQAFIYDPSLFSKGNYIDLFDLFVIVLKTEDLNDPRMDEAFKKIERLLTNE